MFRGLASRAWDTLVFAAVVAPFLWVLYVALYVTDAQYQCSKTNEKLDELSALTLEYTCEPRIKIEVEE